MKKLLLFDFDGVLADSLDMIVRNARITSQRLGLDVHPTRNDILFLKKMEFEELGRKIGVPEQKIPGFVGAMLELFETQTEIPEMFPGIDQVVATLARTNGLGIITGNSSKFVNAFIDRHGIRGFFALVLDKTHPGSKVEKIHHAAQVCHFPLENVLMIGDAVSDIEAARAAHVRCIGVLWGNQDIELLKRARPDFLVARPEDLLKIQE